MNMTARVAFVVERTVAGFDAFHSLVTYSGRFLLSHSETANPPATRSELQRRFAHVRRSVAEPGRLGLTVPVVDTVKCRRSVRATCKGLENGRRVSSDQLRGLQGIPAYRDFESVLVLLADGPLDGVGSNLRVNLR